MDIQQFRIRNFRSIADTKWVTLSTDKITVLIGQNESGKSTIIEALHAALSGDSISPDDVRIGPEPPTVWLRGKASLAQLPDKRDPLDERILGDLIALRKGFITLKCTWPEKDTSGKAPLLGHRVSFDDDVPFEDVKQGIDHEAEVLTQASVDALSAEASATTPTSAAAASKPPAANSAASKRLTAERAANLFFRATPISVLFRDDTGLLPDRISISAAGEVEGPGDAAAKNFLAIADIDLPAAVRLDQRVRDTIFKAANKKISGDFNTFWSQVIGHGKKLSIECRIENYSSDEGDKAGKPHLVFWVVDGTTSLYPRQRSLGVRWFLSFYLQLKATQKDGYPTIYLLDEPGANLHGKAQSDVLKLINDIHDRIPIVYTTHSPDLIEYDKTYRIRAVQRKGDDEDSPTEVIDAHELGTASSDTLSPIFGAMGSNMAKQTVIQRHRNVLLEEMSAFYYMKAFWKLCGRDDPAYFIAATGAGKVPQLVNMFMGWGLDFIVAVDNDSAGRDALKTIKKEVFGDDEEAARKQLLKIPGCPAIEEAFSANDFRSHVIKDRDAVVTGSNAQYMRDNQLSKPIIAVNFWRSVDSDSLHMSDLDSDSRQKIQAIVLAIAALLDGRPAA